MRQFISPAGMVFAVSWQGSAPDLQQLLGTYFDEFESAATSDPSRRGRGMHVDDGDLVVDTGGHMRFVTGRAFLRSKLRRRWPAMTSVRRKVLALACATLLYEVELACGGSSHQSKLLSASNVQSIAVNGGPSGNYANGLFTSVTVCVPGSSNCQNISGVLVDTGSFGLRLLSSALGPVGPSLSPTNRCCREFCF